MAFVTHPSKNAVTYILSRSIFWFLEMVLYKEGSYGRNDFFRSYARRGTGELNLEEGQLV